MSFLKKWFTNHKRCVYVVEAYIQNGGTYMAYHVGRILHEYFGLPVMVVGAPKPSNIIFFYPYDFEVVSFDYLEKKLGDKDILICNPSFSHKFFGLRLPGNKISYVQGVATFEVLDAFFDLYVFVSNYVKEFVEGRYDIDGPIINPFINTEKFSNSSDWETRKNSVMVLMHKHISKPLLKKLNSIYKEKYPDSLVSFEAYTSLSQNELIEKMASHKYYLTLSPVEGFGLPAIEAMASGCTVVGFHGWGGKEFFKHNINSMVTSYPKLEEVADFLHEVVTNDEKAKILASNARTDALRFNKTSFDEKWVNVLSNIVKE